MYLTKSRAQEIRRQDAKIRQTAKNKTDTAIINKTLDALTKLDAKTAYELITNPSTIKGLMDLNAKHNLKCLYALHAIVLMLIDDDMSKKFNEILNQMTDSNIGVLKQCVSIALNFPRLNIETIDKKIQERKQDASKQMIPERAAENNAMLKSLEVSRGVNDEKTWQDCHAYLQQLSDAIEHFVRDPKTPKKNKKTKSNKIPKDANLYSIRDLATRLGATTVQIYNFKNNNKSKTEHMFENVNGHPMLKIQFFAEFEKMFNGRKNAVVSSKKKTSQSPEHKTQLTLKTTEVVADGILALCERIKSELASAEEKRSSLIEDLKATTDDNVFNQILIELNEVNTTVKQKREYLEKADKLLKERDKALEEKKAAEQALQSKAQAVKDIENQITDILTKNK